MLARQGKYNDCLFHRLVPGFMVPVPFASRFSMVTLSRCKQATLLVRVQVVNPTGAHHSVMSMTLREPHDMTVVAWLRWLTKVQTQTGQSCLLSQLRDMICEPLQIAVLYHIQSHRTS
jgi:hypothetical protein